MIKAFLRIPAFKKFFTYDFIGELPKFSKLKEVIRDIVRGEKEKIPENYLPIATNVLKSNIEYLGLTFQEIKDIANSPNPLNLLAKSLAPSIHGHDKIKEAIVLQLAGGCRKIRPDGVITRGDMHMLLIGDPGSGKSQMLKRVTKVAPKSRFTSGKGAMAAGLTDSVVKDEFLGGWSLEAGTLVLSNRVFAIIDEMDKMNKEDRSALHAALAQQQIP